MSGLLKLLPSWAWVALGGLVLVGVVGGGLQLRVAGLQGELADLRKVQLKDAGALAACRETRTNLLELTIEQNAGLANLRTAEQERAQRAQAVQQQAEGRAQQAEQQAQAVMQERTPAGADACATARAAFDEELKRERGL